jgi:hypothetical protein
MAMAAVLFWAGMEKARSLASLVSTLRQLGFPDEGARVAAPILVAAELGVALGLVFQPDSVATLYAVLGLAGTFALSGVIALRLNQEIRCGCFGPLGHGNLGKDQVAALPFWLGTVSLLWLAPPAHASGFQRAASFAALGLTLASVRGVGALRAAREARGDRRSAQEMLVWLPRR